MSHATRSLKGSALYHLLLGALLALQPEWLLRALLLPVAPDAWMRVLGVVLVVVGLATRRVARAQVLACFQWSVPLRVLAVVLLALEVAARWVPPVMLLFGLVEGALALWTWTQLRADRVLLEPPEPGDWKAQLHAVSAPRSGSVMGDE